MWKICGKSFEIRKNIQIVNNVNFSFENKNIILSTLWTKINEIDFYSIKNRLNDFIQITPSILKNKIYSKIFENEKRLNLSNVDLKNGLWS